MAGLLGGVLPWAYSQGDRLKRHVNGLLSDPMGSLEQTAGLLMDKHREHQALQAQAFADPQRPFKVTDQKALGGMVDQMMAGPMGFAPIGMMQAQSGANIKKFLNGTKVIDDNGLPLRVYHGTNQDVSKFKSEADIKGSGNHGIYFTPDVLFASRMAGGGNGANVVPAYLSLKNPLVIDSEADAAKSMFVSADDLARLRAAGHDGIINKRRKEIVVFDGDNVASAIGWKP